MQETTNIVKSNETPIENIVSIVDFFNDNPMVVIGSGAFFALSGIGIIIFGMTLYFNKK